MIPATKKRGHTSSGALSSSRMSVADSPWIKGILRDRIYTDKIAAVIREYSANAVDAHEEVGKGDVPIEVHIPTKFDPEFRVRDYGPGLSEDGVYNVFSRYGESTKRGTNKAIGMLGIGSKSGFAYGDQFLITSWQNGVKSVYVASLTDDDDLVSLLSAGASDEPDGLQISVAVRDEDLEKFKKTAEYLFQFFPVRPKANIDIPELPGVEVCPGVRMGVFPTKNISYRDSGRNLVGVMKGVPYRIDLKDVNADRLRDAGSALFFELGEVSVSATRESLELDDRTTEAIERKIGDLKEKVKEIADRVLRGGSDFLEECIVLSNLFQKLHGFSLSGPYRNLPGPAIHGNVYVESDLPCYLKRVADKYYYKQPKLESHTKIKVTTKPKVYFHNRARVQLLSYELNDGDYVVLPKGGAKNAEKARKALVDMLKLQKVGDLEVLELDSIKKSQDKLPKKKDRSTDRLAKKRKGKAFLLRSTWSRWERAQSNNWDAVDEIPEGAVVMLMKRFTPELPGGWGEVSYAESLMDMVGESMPPVVGVRAVDLDSPDIAELTSFQDWFNSKLKDNREIIKDWFIAFTRINNLRSNWWWRSGRNSIREACQELASLLPPGHQLGGYLGAVGKIPKNGDENVAKQLYSRTSDRNVMINTENELAQRFKLKYPLIMGHIPDESSYKHFVLYITAVDAANKESNGT